jgi:hypothetical protein
MTGRGKRFAIVAGHAGDFGLHAACLESVKVARVKRAPRPKVVPCGHSACAQNFIDTGDASCVKKEEP